MKSRLYITQTQLFFIMLLHSLGRHVSTHFKSSSGPFFKNTDPYYQLLKCIIGSEKLTIFVL